MTEENDLFEAKKEQDEGFEVLNQSSFVVIPVEIIEDVNISAQALRIYCYMRSKVGRWKFYNKDIMKKLDIKSAHSMAKYLKDLISTGWVKRRQNINSNGGFSGYHYEVLETQTENQEITVQSPDLTNKTRMSKNDNRDDKTRMSKNDNHSSCSKDNIKVKKRKYIKENQKIMFDETDQPILEFLENEILKPVFLKYFFYRKDVIKKPFKTIHGADAMFKKLKKLSNGQERTAEEIVDQAIDREWVGLFAVGGQQAGYRRFVIDSKNVDYQNIGHRINQ